MYINGKEICNLCGADRQELATLREQYEQIKMLYDLRTSKYNDLKALVEELIDEYKKVCSFKKRETGMMRIIMKLQQAGTLANGNSKEEE